MMTKIILWTLGNRVVVLVLTCLIFAFGLVYSPFGTPSFLPKASIAVDAIPDIGENQQIVFTKWEGRSPRDIDDQITYPLSVALLGIPGVKTIRSSSMFGFSSIYVIFDEDSDFYWSRSRVNEKLASLAPDLLPEGVNPTLGPDATALGQVFWYTLESRDEEGNPSGGWDLHELRSIQDWIVKPALQSASGVSEVASIGGKTKEYQIEVFPERLEAYGLSIVELARAVKEANVDIGARTMEINRVEYLIRGVGTIQNLSDIEQVVVLHKDDTSIRIQDLAKVVMGPGERRGALDLSGAEAVGGIVVARFGANPVEVINAVKEKISDLELSLPSKIQNNKETQIRIVPVYDRSELIHETIGTLSDALLQQILITVLVVLFLLGNLRSSIVISASLPLAVMISFIAMKALSVDANIMSLAGIAIAIGAMVDVGIVVSENAIRHIGDESDDTRRKEKIAKSLREIAPALATSIATTVISFLPVFAMSASEGKLFSPLAYTKSFAMIGALIVGFLVLPVLLQMFLLSGKATSVKHSKSFGGVFRLIVRTPAFFLIGLFFLISGQVYLGLGSLALGVSGVAILSVENRGTQKKIEIGETLLVGLVVLALLAKTWMPLGFSVSYFSNLLFVSALCFVPLILFWFFVKRYEGLLNWVLENKVSFLLLPLGAILLGTMTWLGASTTLSFFPSSTTTDGGIAKLDRVFPGLENEFMPPFDEGAFLYMPTTMSHASLGMASEQLRKIDARIAAIPEVAEVVGKLGRADSALDPAPVSMFESLIQYHPEWKIDDDGQRVRQWRPHIKTTNDIWNEILVAAEFPGVTSAPKLMPISTRLVMLQSGMSAPMGLKIKGPSIEANEEAGKRIEEALRKVPQIRAGSVFAERIVGKPYIEIDLNRKAIARYGLSVASVQNTIQLAIGGRRLTQVIEGRERYALQIRYARDSRQDPNSLLALRIKTSNGEYIPLQSLASIEYVRGPQVIKSEDTRLVSYLSFDKNEQFSETTVVQSAARYLKESVEKGELNLPKGVSFEFSGTYENQVRSQKRLGYLVPLSIVLIFVLLFLQFKRFSTVLIIFTSVIVALSGGMSILWFYNQPWFLNFDLAGQSMANLFRVGPTNLSVAVWVGFIALIGIATDDGVIMATYLKQRFKDFEPESVSEIRAQVLEAGKRRVRPCLMTSATTILALLPVISSSGRGADIMAPMALPILGGMILEVVTLFVVPLLWSVREETKFGLRSKGQSRR